MDAWMQAVEDRDCKDVHNVEEDIKREDIESELSLEQHDTTEHPMQDFYPLGGTEFDPAEMGKLTSHRKDPFLKGLVEETLLKRYKSDMMPPRKE